MWDDNGADEEAGQYAPVHDAEVAGYGATVHGQEQIKQPLRGDDSYVEFKQLSDAGGSRRPLLRFLAAGMLVSAVVLMIFFVASGALGRWFGVDECEGGPEECDLKTVVNALCPPPVMCTGDIQHQTRMCPEGPGRIRLCIKTATNERSEQCDAGECFCRQHQCGLTDGDTTVSLGAINIGPEGGKKLAKPLKWDTKVKKLQLWQSGLGDEGSAAIADAVKMHTSIDDLNLAKNGITDASCDDLGKLIATNTNIKILNLYNNNIGNDGAKQLADGLKTNSALLELNMGDNEVSEQGAMFMAEAFTYNVDLRKLYLSNNNIDAGQIGSSALMSAVDSRGEGEKSLEITFEASD